MNYSAKRNISLALCALSLSMPLAAYFETLNQLRPFDPLLNLKHHDGKRFSFGIFAEGGIMSARGFNSHSHNAGPLRIWNEQQDALAMLNGFDALTPQGQLRIQLDAPDDGVRGHFKLCGKMEEPFAVAFALRYFFHPHISIGAYLPVYSLKLTDVVWQNQTLDITASDMRVRQYLTNDFFAIVNQLGDGYDISQGWRRTGLGDLALLLEWAEDFAQHKPMLKSVRLNARLGLNVPTGLRQDNDRLFAIPFGYDGAFGLWFGGGLGVNLGDRLRAGFDIELLQTFGHVRERRIKTDVAQTELLLLAKVCAYKDYGLTQQFNLYLEFFNIIKNFSAKVGYQFCKHGEDTLTLEGYQFSSHVANSAISLDEKMSHTIVVNLNYDLYPWAQQYKDVAPQVEFFVRYPFDGKRVVLIPTVGASFGIEF